MSDSVKKYFEDKSEHEQKAIEIAREKELEVRKYLWVLDFEMGRVFLYNIRREDLETEDYEDLMVLKGHKPTNCEWMVCTSDRIYR
tara:strand:- start:136 stop:393 length:258 start_codon:yes stop_codon:yes gene_type:complete